MIGPAKSYQPSEGSLTHSSTGKVEVSREVKKTIDEIDGLNNRLLQLREQLPSSSSYPTSRTIEKSKPKENEDIITRCSRGFARLYNALKSAPPAGSVEAKIIETENTINDLTKKLHHLEAIESMATKIINLLKNENPNLGLNRIMSSTSMDIFGSAIQQIFKNPLKKEEKTRLREFLASNFPQHTKYLCYRGAFEHRYLFPQGLRIIVDYLEKKNTRESEPVLNLPCTVFDEPSHFVEHAIDNPKSVDESPEVFLVRCNEAGTRQLCFHITSLFFKKIDEKTSILIWSDSMAKIGYLNKELSTIEASFRERGEELKIFYLPKRRQGDETNCSIFAIQDAVSFSDSSNKITDQCIQKLRNPSKDVDESSELGFSTIDFPHRFYWMVQKSKLAQTVLESIDPEERGAFQQKYIRDLQQVVPDTFHNLRSERIGSKYEGLIWKEILTQKKGFGNGILSFLRFQ